MPAVRTAVGLVICVVGLVVLLYAGLNFNNLFFVQEMLTRADIPTYGRSVATPAFLGLLVLLDGSFVLGLKRVFSLSVHFLGNIVWLVAVYQLDRNLAVPITNVSAYQQVFYFVLVGVAVFVAGVIVNDIPQRRK
jgi:uncharacterized membrane protein YidH (DUF202 family)